MIELAFMAIAGGSALFGYFASRRFVRERLWAVDAIRSSAAPVVAGVVAGLLASPVAWILPFIGTGSVLLFGFAVGAGVAAGARDTKALPGVR